MREFTAEEKEEYKTEIETCGGFLKTLEYKEAEEYANRCACLMEDIPIIERAYRNGAEFGYNKAKEEDKALIEKMKSCSNCIHYSSTFGLCHYSMGDEDYDCRGRKWEIKENE